MATAAATTLNEIPPDPLHRALRGGRLGEFRAVSDYAACLMPLLQALDYRGEPRYVTEALPHFANSLSLVDLRNTMANLQFDSRPARLNLRRIDPRLVPCLFVPNKGSALVVLEWAPDGIEVFDSSDCETRTIAHKDIAGTAYFFKRIEAEQAKSGQLADRSRWFQGVANRFRPLLKQILLLSFLLNVLALGVPIFIMMVYDRVLATGSASTLGFMVSGITLLLAGEFAFRSIRARMIGYIGARIDMIVGTAVFQHVLHLPPMQTERAPIGSQVARMREFESVREFFTSPLALVFLELPFTAMFILAIALLAGPLAIVPLAMVALFAVAGAILNPQVRRSVSASSKASARRQNFLVETLSNMRAIKYSGGEATWLERYRELSSSTVMASFHTNQIAAFVQAIANVLMLSAGLATVVFGIFRILDGAMTVGALIATMALVWRVLAPLQAAFLTLTKLEQVRSGIQQINSLLRIPPERDPNSLGISKKKFAGRVSFIRVSLRYTADTEPALMGVSFDVQPGQVVAIIGPNGSGKSTLLKMVNGLYQPQAGSVRLDGLDIRQLDPVELRKTVAYVPQYNHLFHGTIAQNLRLSEPTASDDDLIEAARKANVLDDVLALPKGFETRIGDHTMLQLPAGMQQRISLARAYLREAPILLLDEPGNMLDADGDRALMEQIEALRGNTTVFIVTHRPSHMKIADRILVLDSGILRLDGPPGEVLGQLPEGFV